jgi:hypothetical protein
VPFAFSGAGVLTITEARVDWVLTAPLEGLCYQSRQISVAMRAAEQTTSAGAQSECR